MMSIVGKKIVASVDCTSVGGTLVAACCYIKNRPCWSVEVPALKMNDGNQGRKTMK